jgi:hypothetical protein
MKGSKEIAFEMKEQELSDKIKANASLAASDRQIIARPKRNIFQITEEFYKLIDVLEESGGELTPELEEALNQVQVDFQAKAHNYGYVLLQMKNDADAVDKEIERLTKIKKARDNAQKRLKDALKSCMQVLNIKVIKGETITLTLRDSKAIEITDADAVPLEYHSDPKPTEPSKTKIKAAIDEGTEVPGAQQVINTSLQVK